MEKAVHVSEKRDVAKHGSRTLKMVKKGFASSAGRIRMDPDAVARAYLALATQQPSAWTHELDLRPFSGRF